MTSNIRYRQADGSRRSRQEEIYRKLKAELINCHLRPGQHLSITRISRSFQSSNTPVREALIRLEAERLVVVDVDGGFMVRELCLAEMRQLLELLRLLLARCIIGAGRDFAGHHVEPPAALALQSRYRASRVLQAQAQATAVFIEHIFFRVADMSANDEITAIIGNICDRTHFVRVHDLQEAGSGKLLADDLIGLLGALDNNHDEAALRLDSLLQRQIDRLPDIVPKALGAMFANGLNPSWLR